MLRKRTHRWNASVSVFTTTQARTNRSNVMPGGGPYRSEGPEATSDEPRLEKIRGHENSSALTILLLEQREEHRGEVVPKAAQGFGELGPLYRSRVVSVEVPEDVLPVLDVLPQAGEFWREAMASDASLNCRRLRLAIEADGPATIRVLLFRSTALAIFTAAIRRGKHRALTKIDMSILTVSRSNSTDRGPSISKVCAVPPGTRDRTLARRRARGSSSRPGPTHALGRATPQRNRGRLTRPVSCERGRAISDDRPRRDRRAGPRGGRGTRTVHQSGLQLRDADRTRAVRVDGGEPLPELGVGPGRGPDGRRGPAVRRLLRVAVIALLGRRGTVLGAGRALGVIVGGVGRLGGRAVGVPVVKRHGGGGGRRGRGWAYAAIVEEDANGGVGAL